MKIAVTGGEGFIGWHVRCAFHALGIETSSVNRRDFGTADSLERSIDTADVVVHAAGANRGPPLEVAATNIELAMSLARAIERTPSVRLVIYLDSTQRERSTPYGESKRAAAEVIANIHQSDSGFLDLVLPGVFGEHGRPNYNSVVATLCHQLTNGLELTINDDADIELIHAQDVADKIVDAATRGTTGLVRLEGQSSTVHSVADRLRSMHSSYSLGVVPPTTNSFHRALFNTLRSYGFPSSYPTRLAPRTDQRGTLVELVKADTGGQMFISTTAPAVTRGNHYHRRKIERFVVVSGTATISLRRLFSADVVTFEVDGNEPVAIDMPTMHAHNITNVGNQELVTMFWTDEIFDPDRPDTVAELV